MTRYPEYLRRLICNSQQGYLVNGHIVNNQYVVTYRAIMLAKFDCHINTEVHAVKYPHKYIAKGGDRAEVEVVGSLTDASLTGMDDI